MDEREQKRKVRHRLAIIRHAEEVTGNVAATCRYYGISRPCFYKWLRRYEELGRRPVGVASARLKPVVSRSGTGDGLQARVAALGKVFPRVRDGGL